MRPTLSDDAKKMCPLTGRQLREQHEAMVKAGFPQSFRLRWLLRETDLWDSEVKR